jgi:outer membrane lipoprotein-sorting protein
MFKDESEFGEVVDRLNIDTTPNPMQKQKLRRQMLSVFNQAEHKPSSRIIAFRTLRSLIMKSSITKLATAAAVIIAVGTGIYFLGDGSSVAWSQVVEQLNSYTRYKYRQRVAREEGPQIPTMQVYHLNLQQRRQEVEDGSIHIIDLRSENPITVELYPDQKKATVTKLLGFGPKKDPPIIDMVKRFEQQSTERLSTKKVNGKVLHGFRHQPNKYNDFTIWVDPKTKLPVEIELKHTQAGQTLFLDEFEFDFELDASAFSTEIPDGYEVETIIQDYRPESKEITAEDIRRKLNHTAYTIKKLPWIEKVIIMQAVDPLVRAGKVYMTGIVSDSGNNIIIDQWNMHSDLKEAFMELILKEQLVMEAPSGAKLYMQDSEYARIFLNSFAKVNPDFFDIKNLSEERFTRMIVMPDGTIMGLSANKQMSAERLQELVESLVEIKAN